MKKAFFSILFFGILQFACAETPAFFSGGVVFKNRPLIYSAEDALKLYEGKWEGSQNITFYRGKFIGVFTLSQVYEKDTPSSLNCVAEAFRAGTTIAKRKSKMTIENGVLVLRMLDEFGKETDAYIGETRSGEVVWSPYNSFMLYDVSTDSFIIEPPYLRIESVGHKYEVLPSLNFMGVLQTNTSLRKAKAAVPVKKRLKPVLIDKDYFKK